MGLGQSAHTTEALRMGARVTLRMGEQPTRERLGPSALGGACEAYAAAPVPPSEPRRSTGVYWGFSVRLARGLSGVLSGCPFQVRTRPCATVAGRTSCFYSAWASVLCHCGIPTGCRSRAPPQHGHDCGFALHSARGLAACCLAAPCRRTPVCVQV